MYTSSPIEPDTLLKLYGIQTYNDCDLEFFVDLVIFSETLCLIVGWTHL